MNMLKICSCIYLKILIILYMKIVINSHNKSSIALNHLLESMQMYEEYNNYEIIIIIGGYYNDIIYYDI